MRQASASAFPPSGTASPPTGRGSCGLRVTRMCSATAREGGARKRSSPVFLMSHFPAQSEARRHCARHQSSFVRRHWGLPLCVALLKTTENLAAMQARSASVCNLPYCRLFLRRKSTSAPQIDVGRQRARIPQGMGLQRTGRCLQCAAT